MAANNRLLNSINAVFIVFFALIILNIFIHKQYYYIFWICYISIFLIILGIYNKNSDIIISQVIILLIPDLLWIIDFFYILITGNQFLNLASYFFEDRTLLQRFIAIQHIITIPLAIFSLYLIKIKDRKEIILFSFLEVALFFLLARFFSPESDNINCVFHSCTIFSFGYYPIVWFITYFLLILFSYIILIKILLLINKER